MEYDIALVSLPAFTQKCPSLGLANLASYLSENQFDVFCYDYGISFYKTALNKFKVKNTLIQDLNLSLYPLWGVANWLNYPGTIDPTTGTSLLNSLCPVCSKLYQPIFQEFRAQIDITTSLLDSYAQTLTDLDTSVYAFSLLIGNAAASLYVLQKIKINKPDATIILGGPETSLYYRAQFYPQIEGVDFTVYHNEGEIPLASILSYLEGKIPKQSIPGILIKAQGKITSTAPPNLLDLNKLPVAKYDLVQTGYNMSQLKSLDVLTSKGCPYNCTFCNEPFVWGSFRPKSSPRIVDELKYYVENYGIYQFELADNTFSASPSLINALEKLSTAGIVIKWSGNGRINELNNPKLEKYNRLGLTHCYFGIESGSSRILQLMGKNFNISDASTILKACAHHQIKTSAYFMVGFPGETEEDFQKTINFVTNHNFMEKILTSVFTIMPNIPLLKSPFLRPVRLGPKELNAFTYVTSDNVTHNDREKRFLRLHKLWNQIKSSKT